VVLRAPRAWLPDHDSNDGYDDDPDDVHSDDIHDVEHRDHDYIAFRLQRGVFRMANWLVSAKKGLVLLAIWIGMHHDNIDRYNINNNLINNEFDHKH